MGEEHRLPNPERSTSRNCKRAQVTAQRFKGRFLASSAATMNHDLLSVNHSPPSLVAFNSLHGDEPVILLLDNFCTAIGVALDEH